MKKAIKFLLIGLGVIFLFIGSVFTYVYFNREKILKNITEELNAKYDATFTVKDLQTTFFSDFPHFSLTLVNTEIRDSRFDNYHLPLLKAGKIFLQSNLLEFFRGNIKVSSLKITKAAVTIFKTKEGYTNNIFKIKDTALVKKESSTLVDFSIQELMFDDVKFLMTDSIKTNSFDFTLQDFKSTLTRDGSNTNILADGEINFGGLTFRASKGPFIKGQKLKVHWNLIYYPESRDLNIEPDSWLENDHSLFNLSGFLALGAHPLLELQIKNKSLSYKNATNLVNKNISNQLSRYEFDGTMDTEVLLRARIDTAGEEPLVNIKAKAAGITIHWKDIEATGVSFNALFNNHFDTTCSAGDFNTRINFIDFNALIEGIPVKGNFYAHDLKNTRLNADFVSSFKLSDAQHLVNPGTMILKGGNAYIDLHYDGPVKDLVDSKTRKLRAIVNGSVNITNGSIRYIKKPYSFSEINVNAIFDSSDITLRSVGLMLNSTKINARGFIDHVIPFLVNPTQKIIAKLNISSPYINLASFIKDKPPGTVKASKSKTEKANDVTDSGKVTNAVIDTGNIGRTAQSINDSIIASRVKAVKNRRLQKNSPNSTGPVDPDFKESGYSARKTMVASVIDELIQRIEIDAMLNADKMVYKSLSADKIMGTVSIHNEDISVRKLRFNNSNGEFSIDGVLNNKNEMSASVKIDHADAKLIFKSFDNFGQDRFRDDNIEGILGATLNYNCNLNEQMQVVPESMKGILSLSFKEGKLVDCFALGSIGKILFNEDDLKYLEFDEIKSDITLDGYDLNIGEFDLASSFMSLIIKGVYSFNNTNTDLSIQVPVANLKRKKGQFQLSAEQLENYDGANIFLRARPDKNNKLSVAYDPFKKHRDKK